MGRAVRSLVLAVAIAGSVNAADLQVTVMTEPNDRRISAVEDAVEFWNRQLDGLGLQTRLRPVAIHSADDVPETQAIHASSRQVRQAYSAVPGDIVIVLTHGDMASYTLGPSRAGRSVIAIRRASDPPLSNANVARNVIAHEIGHALGLEHNDDASTLMCGRPAPCRPNTFESGTAIMFPLTAGDKRTLRRRLQ